jgi:hypothetical protein
MESMMFVNDTNSLNGLWYDSHKNLITSICVELDILDKNKIAELTNKFLGERPKIKKLVDPKKPKRSKSAWLLFCDDKREQVISSLGTKKMGDVTKQMGVMWKKLSEKEREPYNTQAAKEREKYLAEMEKYNA